MSVAVTGSMKRRHLLLGLSLAALVASQAHAQVVTDIAPDGAAGFDTGTTVVTNGTQTQISGGEASGTNLFHSFARFDLGNGDTATWVRNAADANSITNIINRVRSGTPSNIDGTITIADMPNADFWFINPAGVVFGDGASVQVPNAAYFSTAQELGFGGGQRFSTVTPDGSTFSSAPPQAFGFLGGQGGIGILGAMTTEAGAQQPSSVHFVASDIRVDAPLFGNATEFSFAAVGANPLAVLVSEIGQPVGDGLIEFTPNAEAHVAGARFAADEVLFDGARVHSNGWGYLILRGNRVAATNGAELQITTAWDRTSVIDVEAGNLAITNGATLRSLNDPGNAVPGGAINLTADFISIENGGNVTTFSDGPGRAGDISVNAGSWSSTGSEILSRASSSGGAGNIDIAIGADGALDFTYIVSEAVGVAGGAPGDVSLTAGGALSIVSSSRVRSNGSANAASGNILLRADALTITDSQVDTRLGAGGNIRLDGRIIDITGFINISAESPVGTDPGDVIISASENLRLSGDPFTRDGNYILGRNIDVTAGSMQVSGGGFYPLSGVDGVRGDLNIEVDAALDLNDASIGRRGFTDPTLAGGGAVNIRAASLDVVSSTIFADSRTLDAAGNVTINVDTLFLGSGSRILTSVDDLGLAPTAGAAGSISITANSAVIAGLISSRGGSGDAGVVNLEIADQLLVQGGEIGTEAGNDGGAAGNIRVNVGRLQMLGGSISSSATNLGPAGTISIAAGNVDLQGGRILSEARDADAGGISAVVAETLQISGDAIISTGTLGQGFAGEVSISAKDIVITSGLISSSALKGSTGDAGFVQISTPNLLFIGDDAVVSASTAGPGAAGAVLVTAGELQMFGGEIASLTRGAGDAGLVLIDAGAALLEGEATINSLADGPDTGDAGDVFIKIAGQFVVTDGATVAASTLGVGNAGEVNVTADSLVLDGGQITSSTSGSGDAGDVSIVANDLLLLFRSSIDSRSEAGASGDAGDVTVDITDILRLEPESSISASSLGSGFAGLVEVRARVLDMAGGAINSFTAGSGDAGLVGVFVDELNMSGGRIDSASDSPLAGAGDAGSVFIAARTASLSGNAQIDSRASTGDAGDVTLDVSGLLEISDSGQVSAATTGSGQAGLVQVFADELIMTGGAINSFSNSSGDAGLVDVTARVIDMSGGRIDSSSDSDAPDAGDAGGVLVRGNDVRLSGNALIDSRGITGDAGDVQVEVLGDLSMADEAQISAATDGSGDAGSVFVMADLLTMTGGEINSITTGSGRAGLVAVEVDELVMTGGRITSAAQNPLPVGNLSASVDAIANLPPPAGDAGNVFLLAGSAQLFGPASIDSTSEGSRAGTVDVLVDQDLLLFDGAQISTTAFGAGDAGDITIAATNLALDNFSQISSTAARDFSAGTIEISAQEIRILNGSEISTNSENGPAGDIGLFLPLDGFLYLAGREPGVITTSSGANTGGQIIISDPFLILSEGGSILALGQQGGANVQIQSAFFIRSSDRINLVSVDGSLLIESNVGEQITGTEVADIPFLDASGILSGQCTGVRQGGEVSQFSSRVTGPYAPPDASDEVEDEMDGSSPDQIVHVEQGALAPCG